MATAALMAAAASGEAVVGMNADPHFFQASWLAKSSGRAENPH
jgi:hypothetical protein